MKQDTTIPVNDQETRSQVVLLLLLRKEDIAMSIDKFFFSLFWTHTKYPLILRTSKLAEKRQKEWRIFQWQELSWYKRMSMFWFYFILGSNFIFLCLKLVIIYYNTQKQKKTKFEPRIKLNHTSMSTIWQLGKIYDFIWTVQLHPPALMSL